MCIGITHFRGMDLPLGISAIGSAAKAASGSIPGALGNGSISGVEGDVGFPGAGAAVVNRVLRSMRMAR